MVDMMTAKIQAEVDRIKAGPHEGSFTFPHHEGPVVEKSDNIMERVEYILTEKARTETPEQIYTRLRHIYYVPEEIAKTAAKAIYDKTCNDAKALYDKTCNDAGAIYDKTRDDAGVLKLIPDCKWDGKTIFGGKQ